MPDPDNGQCSRTSRSPQHRPIIPAPLDARPPLWVRDLLGDAAPTVTAPGGVTISAAALFAQFSTALDNAAGMRPAQLRRTRGRRVHRNRRGDLVAAAASDTILELCPRTRVPRWLRARPLHGVQCRPLRRMTRIGTARRAPSTCARPPRRRSESKGADLSIFCLAAPTPGTQIEMPGRRRRGGPRRATVRSHRALRGRQSCRAPVGVGSSSAGPPASSARIPHTSAIRAARSRRLSPTWRALIAAATRGTAAHRQALEGKRTGLAGTGGRPAECNR